MSWITREDLIDAFVWVMENERICPEEMNISSPNPVTNAEFARALGREDWQASGIFGAAIRSEASPRATCRTLCYRVIRMAPERLDESGFEFVHPEIEGALRWALDGGSD